MFYSADGKLIEYMDVDANYYRALLARYCVQMAACLLSCFYLPSIWNAVIGGFFMASVWQQVAFYCHDITTCTSDSMASASCSTSPSR